MASDSKTRRECATNLRDNQDKISHMTAFLGLDGFVDEIVHVVDQRQDAENFNRLPSIQSLSDRIEDASGKSTNLELVTHRIKIGGNGPIMANALATFGLHVTYLGALGYPNAEPVFADFCRTAETHSIAQPGHTDALEFDDGKIMASKLTPLNEITWANIEERFGRRQFAAKILGSQFVAFVNWTMIPYMSDIWEKTLNEILVGQPQTRRKIFFDLADPEKRTREDIRRALELISLFGQYFDVTLGLNEKEAFELAEVFDLSGFTQDRNGIEQLTVKLADRIPVETLLVHPVRYALAFTNHELTVVDGPHVARPVITTGAGDHFNAGFSMGKLLSFENQECLLCGVASSGFYVMNGKSPTVDDLTGLMENWPEQPSN